MTINRFCRAAAAIMILAVAACGSDSEGEASKNESPITAESAEATPLKLGIIPGSPVTVAAEVALGEGFYEKYGLDVEVVNLASAPEMLAASLHGDVEIFTMAAPAAFGGYAAGECTSALPIASRNVNNIIAQPDIGKSADPADVNSLAALKGKSIGVVALGSSGEEFARTLLESAGLDPSQDVSFVGVGGAATTVAAFEAGGVDAVLAFPPVEAMLGDGNYSLLYEGIGNDESPLAEVVSTYFAARCDWAAENEATAVAFCSALWDAADLLASDEGDEVATSTLASSLSLDADVAAATWDSLKDAIPEEPAWDAATWEAQADFVPPSVSVDAVPPADEALFGPCTSDPR